MANDQGDLKDACIYSRKYDWVGPNIPCLAINSIHCVGHTKLTAHEGNGGKLMEVKSFNLGLLFTEARKAEANSRPRLNFTEGAVIFPPFLE